MFSARRRIFFKHSKRAEKKTVLDLLLCTKNIHERFLRTLLGLRTFYFLYFLEYIFHLVLYTSSYTSSSSWYKIYYNNISIGPCLFSDVFTFSKHFAV